MRRSNLPTSKIMHVLQAFKPVKLFILDVDGVLTDGQVYLMEDESVVRRMNIKDGWALQWAVKKGYHFGVISGAKSAAVRIRMERLGIPNVHLGVDEKEPVIEAMMAGYGLRKEEVLYMGDDIPDLPCLKAVGLACCPADAVPEVKAVVHYISPFAGGQCCVRDVIEKVLRLNGHWPA